LITPLAHIASISSGYYQKPDPIGNVFYLHGKHFDQEGHLQQNALLTKDIQLDERTAKHLLQDKDLLFIAKGENNRACLYYEHYGKAIASSLFLVIRVQTNDLLPEYLQWLINAPSTQNKLSLFARGSHIPSISKKYLGELEVYLPPLKTQQQILQVQQHWQKEKSIHQQLLQEKEHYYQSLLIQLAKENAT